MATSGGDAANLVATRPSSMKPQLLPDVVESLGMGLAQILVLLVGPGGIFLVEGILFTSFSAIPMSVSSDLGLTAVERGALSTMSFIGLFIGVACAGVPADRFGRRPIVLASYVTLALSLFLCSFLPNWGAITIAGLGAGAGVGLGMPPSIALLSEITPAKWRIAMRAVTGVMYCVGMVYICFLAGQDDASLAHVHWRRLLFNAAVPIVGFGVLAAALLPESPVFLATKGFKSEAEYLLRNLARRNGKSISGDYELPAGTAPESVAISEQLKIIFSPQVRYVTVAATFASFVLNISLYGGMYAQPQVFATTASLPAAYETMLTALPGAIANLAAGGIGDYVSRRSGVVFATVIGWSTAFAMVIGGGVPQPRNWGMEIIFQYGALCGGVATSIGFTVVFQIAVEIYPSATAATGAAFVIGVGRIGAIIAPDTFEFMQMAFGTWQSFYWAGGMCNVVCMIVWMFAPANPVKAMDCSSPDPEKGKILESGRAGYSTLDSSAKEV